MQVVVSDHGWKKLVCKSSLLHVAIQCTCSLMIYLYIHSNQSIAGRRKPCVDKTIVACLFEGGPEVCWSFEGELASLLSANF